MPKYLGYQIFTTRSQENGIFGSISVIKFMVSKSRCQFKIHLRVFSIGSAFRFHPNGVLFTTPTAYPSIYGTRANVRKGRFYEVWTRNEKGINTLGTVDKMVHARKRRILNSVFSERAVRSSESFIITHVNRWIDLLEEDASGGWSEATNFTIQIESLVFDIMGDLSFGSSFNIKERKANPFKNMPHNIAKYMSLMYPVS